MIGYIIIVMRKHMLKLGSLIILLLVLASCGNVEEKNKKDSLDNDELINFAIEDFISYENDEFLHSICSKNPSVDDIRAATDIERWKGK